LPARLAAADPEADPAADRRPLARVGGHEITVEQFKAEVGAGFFAELRARTEIDVAKSHHHRGRDR
jgi:hypothetical protein